MNLLLNSLKSPEQMSLISQKIQTLIILTIPTRVEIMARTVATVVVVEMLISPAQTIL